MYMHWASKETYHFFRATLTKIHFIKINHIKAQISYDSPYEAHLKNQRVAFAKTEKYAMNRRGSFVKNQRKCSLRISTKGRLFRTFNGYSFNFNGGFRNRRILAFVRADLRAREVSSFCDFWKITFCDFTLFYYFLTKANVVYFPVLGKEYYR